MIFALKDYINELIKHDSKLPIRVRYVTAYYSIAALFHYFRWSRYKYKYISVHHSSKHFNHSQ